MPRSSAPILAGESEINSTLTGIVVSSGSKKRSKDNIAACTKGTQDVAVEDTLIAKIDEIAEIFWATKK